MVSSTFSRLEDPDDLVGGQLSHWLPALRPDTLDTVTTSTTNDFVPIVSNATFEQPDSILDGNPDLPADVVEDAAPRQDAVAEEKNHSIDDIKILDQLQRSTSFPIPSTEASGQVEETEKAGGAGDAENAVLSDFPATVSSTADFDIEADESKITSRDQLHDILRDAEESAMFPELSETSLAGDVGLLQDDVSERFTEGIPLLSSGPGESQSLQDPLENVAPEKDAFGAIEDDAEGSFFSQLGTTTTTQGAAPTLDRKSTTDVLASLYAQKSTEPDSPVDFFQQLGQTANVEQDEFVKDTLDPSTGDPWAAALDDEDEFLVEDADDLLPDSDPDSPSSFIATIQQGQQGQGQVPALDLNTAKAAAQNPYAPQQPSTSTPGPLPPAQLSPKAHGNVGFSRPGLGPMKSFQAHLQQPSIPQRAESFADQSKGGYKSPYDLPLDISKSKRKPQIARVVSQPQRGLPPPPRSSSMAGGTSLQTPFESSNSAIMPPASAATSSTAPRPGTAPQRIASSSSFFEELPLSARPRPPPSAARYTPTPPSIPGPPASSLSASPPQRIPSTTSQPSIAESSNPPVEFQLRPPERLDPYANVASQPNPLPIAAIASRYSPAPSAVPGVPPPTASSRYSPAPATLPPSASNRYASPPVNTQAPSPHNSVTSRYAMQTTPAAPPSTTSFQPRTSSPLAYHTRPAEDQSNIMPPPPLPKPASSRPSSPPAQDYPNQSGISSHAPVLPPQQALHNAYAPEFTPPKRSQTQSPGRQVGPRPTFAHVTRNSFDRPASAQDMLSPGKQSTSYVPTRSITSMTNGPLETVDFVLPSDGTETDPLERWKGAPVVTFGFGGQLVTSFPTRTPRYSSGMLKPQMKTGPGDVRVQKMQEALPLASHITNFPGPLRGKSKKKDVVSWLTSAIARLEAASPSFLGVAQVVPDPRKRHEEKIMLWRLIKILVECDGHLDTAEALKAVNIILTPELHAIDEATASQYSEGQEPSGIYRPRGASMRLEQINPTAVENLRKHLLKGNRTDAVWLAVDNRLWSHALLIASTLEPAVWRQVVQEFVRQEVKSVGSNAESLAALYEIFGGNMEDSIDQLVPPSARAGLQMVSTVDAAGPIKNALDGLDKWKETLALILNNRCRDDFTALLTLARLLGDYGRVEASHICFLFARTPAAPNILGSLDDQQASAVLLGADQRNKPAEIHHDEDAILLTEVYEFATSTLAGTSAATPLPHLAAYKLQRAKQLADHGYKSEAQAYCDAVAAGLKTGGKVSPYYHPVLLAELDEVSNRLKQIPVQGSSWISKPSMEKVSGSIFSKFTNFVAGDDSDAASQGSGKDAGNADIGPFANITGSPSISRSGSPSNSYGHYPATTAATTMAGSRYAPNGILSARSSSEFARGRPSLDSQRSPPGTSHGNEPRHSIYSPIAPSSQTQSPARSVSYQPLGTSPNQQFSASPSYGLYQSTPPQSSYLPNSTPLQPTIAEEQQAGPYMPTPPPEGHSPYMLATPQDNGQQVFGGYLAPQGNFSSDLSAVEPTDPPPEPNQSYGYEPPADTGYVPYQPEPASDDEDKKQKPAKKSFMDDDDDSFPRLSASGQQSNSSAPAVQAGDNARRKANDEAADAAFRAAAEADAQRAKDAAAAKRSSGWFGGWLGGAKKAEGALDAKAPAGEQKVHRANLGESKMKLYYDKDLKKWINPDDPDAGKGKLATPPPPPRMGGTPGPPRAAGGSAPPPTLSRSSTPASASGLLPPSSDGIAATLPPSVNASLGLSKSAAPSPIGPPPTPDSISAPTPNRTPTSAVSTNPIDDLLGPPTGGRKVSGRAGKKAKGGRYIDVMAK